MALGTNHLSTPLNSTSYQSEVTVKQPVALKGQVALF
ncbi:unnamed protein product, partial [marine sediment metagenome]